MPQREVLDDWGDEPQVESELVSIRHYRLTPRHIDAVVARTVERVNAAWRARRLQEAKRGKGTAKPDGTDPTVHQFTIVGDILQALNAAAGTEDRLSTYVDRELMPYLEALAQRWGLDSAAVRYHHDLRALLRGEEALDGVART